MRETILSRIATFVVDRSLFPDKSHLVSNHWRCSGNYVLLATRTFTSSVELQYRNAYAAELCGYLAVLKSIAWVIDEFPVSNVLIIKIDIDYASVIARISSIPLITPFSTHLHQIV